MVVVRFDTAFPRLPAEEFKRCSALPLGPRLSSSSTISVLGLKPGGASICFEECSPSWATTSWSSSRWLAAGKGSRAPRFAPWWRGDMEEAAGRWTPFLEGVVVSGDARGRALGYPTANLSVDPDLVLPGDGVYVTQAAPVNPGARRLIVG